MGGEFSFFLFFTCWGRGIKYFGPNQIKNTKYCVNKKRPQNFICVCHTQKSNNIIELAEKNVIVAREKKTFRSFQSMSV